MPRTTLDIDPTVLQGLKRLRQEQGRSLGELASELLADALTRSEDRRPEPLGWVSRPMGARLDLEDKEAVRRALEHE
jgi:hypothetical protein